VIIIQKKLRNTLEHIGIGNNLSKKRGGGKMENDGRDKFN
jgi:hypothetical protein